MCKRECVCERESVRESERVLCKRECVCDRERVCVCVRKSERV